MRVLLQLVEAMVEALDLFLLGRSAALSLFSALISSMVCSILSSFSSLLVMWANFSAVSLTTSSRDRDFAALLVDCNILPAADFGDFVMDGTKIPFN